MKKLFIFIVLFFVVIPFVSATEASKFLEKQYGECNCKQNVHITVKKEHTEEYQQKIGEQIIPAITYGYGDLKAKKVKKCRISYIVLLNEKCEPMWGYIIPR